MWCRGCVAWQEGGVGGGVSPDINEQAAPASSQAGSQGPLVVLEGFPQGPNATSQHSWGLYLLGALIP